MRILILGSEGFIGKSLLKFYLRGNASVYGADLLDAASEKYNYFKVSRLSPEFDELLSMQKYDVCINAAGSGNVNYSMTHPVSDFEANCLDTIRVLDGIKRYQSSCRYLHISSAAVYGNPDKLPILENNTLQPISPYGWHKLIAENICREYSSVYGLGTAIARPFSVYGPGLKKQLFWDIYQKTLNVSEKSSIELWGTGRESRDFIFISDLVSAFDTIIRQGDFKGETYNVASGNESFIDDVVSIFVKSLSRDLNINFSQKVRAGDPQNWQVDVSKIKALGFSPAYDLQTGLQEVAQWLKDLE
jgi:UDP-glucose 4-epimerase